MTRILHANSKLNLVTPFGSGNRAWALIVFRKLHHLLRLHKRISEKVLFKFSFSTQTKKLDSLGYVLPTRPWTPSFTSFYFVSFISELNIYPSRNLSMHTMMICMRYVILYVGCHKLRTGIINKQSLRHLAPSPALHQYIIRAVLSE